MENETLFGCPRCGSATAVPQTIKLRSSIVRKRKCKNKKCNYIARTIERWENADEDRTINGVAKVIEEQISKQTKTLFSFVPYAPK